jgi:3'(2'), 5'-bisphosphate nucleotidase
MRPGPLSKTTSIEAARRLVFIAREAGRAILEVYGSGDFAVTYKEDSSPLTEADRRSHDIISSRLHESTPDIPVLSEEGSSVSFEERSGWAAFYLVDPLDGTKEFVKRNGEFTVNIAVMARGRPALGVVYIPVRDTAYFAAEGQGAFRQVGDDPPERISCTEKLASDPLLAIASRSHGAEETERFLSGLNVTERISAGSALKFCFVAEGRADIYPRFAPTWEWDTAAGHALLLEAGGRVIRTDVKAEIEYNKPVLKHPGFIAAPAVLIEGLRL